VRALVGVPIKWLCEVHGATIKTRGVVSLAISYSHV